ncbi:biotin--protein ligase family [Chlamydia pneumoniae LPCoLN]|uniref:BPL-N domain-containing protein n=1 Tax=Chlamydia pneumoniae TaxID=83558 RepID=UPI0001BD9DA3|nr:BPL-N domain-containing protein [Chlamydia pneumoniae]ACZ33110.1 biotin--protein ligase family [Chlamydia pneumoniae LPCoLN]ETR80014.1 Biotin-protein ligase [Chlamydia pneumoniae B21]
MLRNQVLVYCSEGVSPYYLRHTIRFLKHYSTQEGAFDILRVDGNFLIKNPFWEETTRLLVFPGGADRPYHRVLHGLGTARIFQYVSEGGNFLGICAGAYFGSKMIYFYEPEGAPLQGARDLGFFPGTAKGPAYRGNFSYVSPSGVRVSPQLFSDFGLGYAMFNGGRFFEGSEGYPGVNIESRYDDLPGKPASIVSRIVGKGLAVLSGPHIEYLPHYCRMVEENVQKTREFLQREGTTLDRYCQNLVRRLLQPAFSKVDC